jgi:hypothetical protein
MTPAMSDKLTDLPIVPFPSGDKRSAQELRRSVQQAGAVARCAGLPITKCQPFVDPDMTVDWQIGWRYADEFMSGKRDRTTGLLRTEQKA